MAATGEEGGAWHVEHRSTHAGAEAEGEGAGTLARIGKEEVLAQYGCKVEHLVRHIKYLRRADPTAKCVVFTQWTVMQQLVHHALESHHVGVRLVAGPRAKREKAIDAFLFHPAVAVLILCSATDDVSGTQPPTKARRSGALTLRHRAHSDQCQTHLPHGADGDAGQGGAGEAMGLATPARRSLPFPACHRR